MDKEFEEFFCHVAVAELLEYDLSGELARRCWANENLRARTAAENAAIAAYMARGFLAAWRDGELDAAAASCLERLVQVAHIHGGDRAKEMVRLAPDRLLRNLACVYGGPAIMAAAGHGHCSGRSPGWCATTDCTACLRSPREEAR